MTVEDAKKKAAGSSRRFTRLMRSVKESLAAADQYHIEFLEGLRVDLANSYTDLDNAHEAYMDLLDDATDKDAIDKVDQLLDATHDDFGKVKVQIAKLKKEQKEKLQSAKKSSESVTDEKTFLKTKKIDPPEFKGDIRAYPAFKRNYQKHMEKHHGKDGYLLLSCLSDDVKESIGGDDDNYDSLVDRLDKKYGRPEKLTATVLKELNGLKRVTEGDTKGLVRMIDTVEKAWLDLKRAGLAGEMDNTTMIGQIERILPEIQKREWTLRKNKKALGFPDLLQFLIEEKEAAEYMMEEVRSVSGARSAKVNFATLTDDEECTGTTESVLVNLLQKQLETSNQVLQGLQNVTQALNSSGNTTAPRNHPGNTSSVRAFTGNRKRCWFHGSDTHDINDCSGFRNIDNAEKLAAVRKNGACFCCLLSGHITRNCPTKKQCGATDTNGQTCSLLHNQLLHSAHVQGLVFHNAIHVVNHSSTRDPALLMFNHIPIKGKLACIMWDPGATTSLITHKAAQKRGLVGTDVVLTITKVGNDVSTTTSKEYVVPLRDLNGTIWHIKAFGMDAITANVESVSVDKVAGLFENITVQDIQRPTGEVELLIGMDCCSMFPDKVQQSGNLQLMWNQFGYCLRGTHKLISIFKPRWDTSYFC